MWSGYAIMSAAASESFADRSPNLTARSAESKPLTLTARRKLLWISSRLLGYSLSTSRVVAV